MGLSERKFLTAAGDIIANLIAVLISLYIWSRAGVIPFGWEFLGVQWGWFVALPLLWILFASVYDCYSPRVMTSTRRNIAQLLRVNTLIFLMYLALYVLSPRDALPRWFIFFHAVLSFTLVSLWRAWRPFLRGYRFKRRALIVGSGWNAQTILETLQQEAPDEYEIIGTVAESIEPGVLGTGRELPELARKHEIGQLILAYNSEIPGEVFAGLMSCYEQGIAMIPMPILYEQLTGRVPIEHVGRGDWAVILPLEGETLTQRLYLAAKRVMDISLALIGLMGFGALLPFLAIIMRLDSPGATFYAQERLGRSGRPFKLIKLRTMIPDAEKSTGPVWAQQNDPRITRVGRFLRRTRLDEFPQLINVLRGEMSIIGPRPERAHFVALLTEQIPFYRTRLAVKPGVTGWAQVRYRYGSSVEDALVKLQYDLYYIRHQSLWLDVVIILRTAGKMFTMSGT